MRRNGISVLLILVLVSSLMTGCASKEMPAESLKANTKIKIGFSFDTFVIPRWQRDREVFVAKAKELGAEVDVQNANGNVDTQVEQIQYFIEEGVDVIAVVPIKSESLKNVAIEAKKAGIPVISYDRLMTDCNVNLYVSFDNEEVGTLMGETLLKRVQSGNKVLMLCGPLEDANVSQVERGFVRVMEKHQIEILDKAYMSEWNADHVTEYIEANLDKVEQVQAIMCGNDALAGQAITTLSEHQLLDKIAVIGQDADLDACQRIVEDIQYMTVYKPVDQLAEKAAQAAVQLAKGEKLKTEENMLDGTYQIPYIRLTPLAVVKENMNATVIDGGFHTKEDVYLNRPELIQ
ncbi:MAG: substrate-binding domain-containing protein [Hespellia sp.]|nr:substrate-binding domain-containing protein [Hespellia sp.]